jgi:hypothetical protein
MATPTSRRLMNSCSGNHEDIFPQREVGAEIWLDSCLANLNLYLVS